MREILELMIFKQCALDVVSQWNLYVVECKKSGDGAIKKVIAFMQLDGRRISHKYL